MTTHHSLNFTDENKKQALTHIEHLTGDQDSVVCFQTFTDPKPRPKPDPLADNWHGKLCDNWEKLKQLNTQGAGVFITINQTDNRGTKKENITDVRAVWQEDDDGAGWDDAFLEPSMVVESSPGKFHRYFLFDEPAPVKHFDDMQQSLVHNFGSDPNAKNVNRVLRLSGLYHVKNRAKPHLVKIVQNSGPRHNWEAVMLTLPEVKIEKPTNQKPAGNGQLSKPGLTRHMLSFLDPDADYEYWLRVGQALHHDCGGGQEGLNLWDAWSQGRLMEGDNPFDVGEAYKYDEGNCAHKWTTFGKYTGPSVTLGTIWKEAKESGWNGGYPEGVFGDKLREVDEIRKAQLVFEGALGEVESRANQQEGAQKKSGFELMSMKEVLNQAREVEWLIDGLIPRYGWTQLLGKWKCGKTFLVVDLLCHIALKLPWRGSHAVKGGPVVVIAGEGHKGLRKRFEAFAEFNFIPKEAIENAPIVISSMAATLDEASSAKEVQAAIQEAVTVWGKPPVAIIIDTLARSMAGDENDTKAMNAFIRSVDQHLGMDIAKIIVHHCGHGDSKRGRGASSLPAALDGEYLITKGQNGISMHCNFLKDGAAAQDMSWLWHEVEVFKGNVGEEEVSIKSLALQPVDEGIIKTKGKLNTNQTKLLELIESKGTEAYGIGVKVAEIKRLAVENGVYARVDKALDGIKSLRAKGHVVVKQEYVILE